MTEGGGASRTTEPATGTSAATDVSLREHLAQRLHESERRIDERDRYLREADRLLAEERDRRYAEVAIEREKALAIKERADETARILVAENQAYRDEKGNELRSQIERERGLYSTRVELTAAIERIEAQIKPLGDFVASQQGRTLGIGAFANAIYLLLVIGLGIAAIYFGTTR